MSDELIPPSRRDRLHVRRAWRRRLAVASAALVAVVAVTAAALVVLDDSTTIDASISSGGSTSAGGVTSASSPVISGPLSDLEQLPKGRPLSHDDPLRLWVGGDSLSGAIGPVIGQYSEDSGVVDALVDYRVSSGLATRVRDWPEYAADLLETEDPEAIVFMVGANDAIIVSNNRSDWEPDYRAKVREMMDLLVGGDRHRTVFWIGSPPMRLSEREEGIVELNRVYKEEALLRPEVVYIDAYSMFEGPEGGYSSSIFLPDRGTLYVRSGDGVHFNSAGAEWLGFNVWQLIDQRWDVGSYAEPDLPIDYRTEPGGNTGCCEEPSPTDDSDPPPDETSTSAPCSSDATCETTTSTDVTTTIVEETTTTVPPSDPTTSTSPPPST